MRGIVATALAAASLGTMVAGLVVLPGKLAGPEWPVAGLATPAAPSAPSSIEARVPPRTVPRKPPAKRHPVVTHVRAASHVTAQPEHVRPQSPKPKPAPKPEPTTPKPAPRPEPKPKPDPTPTPAPAPAPAPAPDPAPAPAPAPAPSPAPEPPRQETYRKPKPDPPAKPVVVTREMASADSPRKHEDAKTHGRAKGHEKEHGHRGKHGSADRHAPRSQEYDHASGHETPGPPSRAAGPGADGVRSLAPVAGSPAPPPAGGDEEARPEDRGSGREARDGAGPQPDALEPENGSGHGHEDHGGGNGDDGGHGHGDGNGNGHGGGNGNGNGRGHW